MLKITATVLFASLLFGGVLISLRLGWALGRRRLTVLGPESLGCMGAVEGAIFGLMGLLIAFTFTGAASRFESRRSLIIEQVNAIGTAYLRLDLLQEPARDSMRELLREYLNEVIQLGEDANDPSATSGHVARMHQQESLIWKRAVFEVKNDGSQPLAQVLLPALNQMFDIGNTRLLATRQHPPIAVFAMLAALVLFSALFAGFGMAKAEDQSRLHAIVFAAVTALSIYLILDIEYPRLGLVRVDQFDSALVELRDAMMP